ncbi:hypothetical protein CYY_004181 [Polysphondylium violaceum]|uniref:Uncharacterized protein n=1 Tax=Polysphondylium violaceum TaxID=133409 RepID=A0A8J4PV04_9MYCE|nr:hypothetical protein CYY_004181 [Polysphondylium violaceum]
MKISKVILLLTLIVMILVCVNSSTLEEFEQLEEAEQLNELEQFQEEGWVSPYKKREEAERAQRENDQRRNAPKNADRCYGVRCPAGFHCNEKGECVMKCGVVWCVEGTKCDKDLFHIPYCSPR